MSNRLPLTFTAYLLCSMTLRVFVRYYIPCLGFNLLKQTFKNEM